MTFWEYLAGFVDGEGTITIKKTKYGGGHQNDRFCLLLELANTNKTILQFVRRKVGGWIGFCAKHTTNKRDSWKWCLWSGNAAKVISRILPYLHIKRQQAKLAIKFQDVIERTNKKGHRIPLTHRELETRRNLWRKILSLNGHRSLQK